MSYAASASVERIRAVASDGFSAVALGAGLGLVLAAQGGYFPTSWGWSGTALAWAAVLAAALGDIERPSWLELGFVGLLAAFAGWIALSLAWTTTQSQTGAELDRMLVYVAGALAVMTVVGAERVGRLLAGVVAGVSLVCLYALSTRLFPHASAGDTFAGSRLATPIGYWNGLGMLAAMGTMLSLVFAARARSPIWRGVATAAVPMLLTTLYFTYGRGAWIALFVGAAVLFATDRDRLQLLGSAAPAALLGAFAIWRASQEAALTHTSPATVQTAVHEGRSLAAVLAGVCLVAGYAGWLSPRVDRVWTSRRAVGMARLAIAVAALVVVVAALVRFGSPITMVQRGYDSFVGTPTSTTDLNSRLFSLSNNGRLPAWKVAWHAFEHHPLTGIGAGGFENYWNQHRSIDEKIRDAHNFYLETLAEGGIVGGLLLFGALALPLIAFRRVRQNPLAAGALAAFVVFLVHAIADWDWELSGITLVAIFCGGSLLLAGRGAGAPRVGRLRWPVIGVAAVVGLAALAGLAGRLSLNLSASATRNADTGKAISEARLAHRLMPWSAEAWSALGAAQLRAGDRTAALASDRAAIAKSPGDWSLWVDLAKADTGAARWHDFATALRLNPLGQDEIRTIAQQILTAQTAGGS